MLEQHPTFGNLLWAWLSLFAIVAIAAGFATGFLQARKIQPGSFRWANVRRELKFGLLNLALTTLFITLAINGLKAIGWIETNPASAEWWVIAGEFALSFFLFDAYFYWVHRAMHLEPYYSRIHKLHHRSTSPVPITSWSMNPVEGIIEGAFTPLFLMILPIHDATVSLIVPTSLLMGLYVHCGFEVLPAWWNKSWLTKWFISATFHDQHHRYFTGNFGGYTTIWDRLCGTMRGKYEADYENAKARIGAVPEVRTKSSA